VLWLLAGWERSAEIELVLSRWAQFGLTRQSCARGLDALEQANLVSGVRQQGRPAIVTLRHVGDDWPSHNPAAVLAAQGEPS
jgi:hypothetical protein